MHQIDKVQGMYYVFKGDHAYKNLKLAKAIKFYNKGLNLYPAHYSAWYNLGNIYVVYEDYYSALYAYSQAFKYNPKMMTARMNYGVIAAEKLGNFDSALEQYNKIIKTKRKIINIPYVFKNGLSTKENKAIAYYNIGVTYRYKSIYSNDNWELQRKYLSKAIDAYKKSLKISPKRYDTLYNLGVAYQIAGRYNEAGECYCKAIELKPMSYEAHYNLAVLLRGMHYYKEAYEEIDKAATLITALGQNSAAEIYLSVIMNDITVSLYQDKSYQKYLATILEEEKKKVQQHSKSNKKTKKSPDDEHTDEIDYSGNLIDGKVVVTEEMDNAIIKNFGKCPSMSLFIDNDDD